MAEHAEVFISGTTRDLGSYRREIKEALLTLKIFPIEESNFELTYGPLVAMLRDRIGRCDVVIHLAGFSYGAEPPQRPPGERRRSYTQIEYDVARELKKPLYLFLAAENYESDKPSTQSDEEKELQLTHRRAIEQCGDIYYHFTGREELGSRIRELRFPARSAEAPGRVVNLPYNSLGPLFKGRDAALVDLRRRLRSGPCQAIHGLGGVGKTRLAIEYAWRHASDYTALLFVSSRSPVELRANLARLCNPLVLNLPEQTQPEEAARVSAVFRWLGENPGWLLMLDNADTQEAASGVEETLPRFRGGQVIITSRLSEWSPAVQTAEPLSVLDETEAAAFLLERTEAKRRRTLSDPQEAGALAREMGGLALALEQAGAYVVKNGLSFSEYRQRWESRKAEVLAWYDKRLMNYTSSVAVTWQTTIEELSQSERKLLNILAWLAPEPIPLSLLEGNIVDGADARDALAGLASWSLARWMADEDGFTIHRLVQEITRQRLPDSRERDAPKSVVAVWKFAVQWLICKITRLRLLNSEKDKALDSAIALLDRALPSPKWDQKGWQLWEQLSPHCRTLLNRIRDHVLEPKATRIMNQLALWFDNCAEYGEAEPLYRRALAIYEKSFGPDHPNVATGLNNLALLLSATNRLAEAEPLYRRALAIDEKSFDPDHPKVATGLNNLASLLRDTNRLAEAEPLYRRALAIYEKSFGPDHPDVATSLNNLAELLRDSNRLAEAEPLYRRALAIDEKSFGPDHPNVATGLNNLALLLSATNRLAEAEPLYRRALAITEKSFGPDHPNVATGLNNLAELLSDTNRLAEAEQLDRRALAIDEKSFGPDHPKVAVSLNGLASLLRATNRPAEAEPLFRRALAIDEKSFGPDHPEVAIDLNNLALLLSDTNRPAEAEPLYCRALAITEKSFGPDHPNVATGLNNLALLLSATNQPAAAEPLYCRALAITEKSFGPDHPKVAASLNGLASLLSATNRPAEAEPLFRRALAIDEKSFGPDHPGVAIDLNNLASLLSATNRLAEAEPLSRRHLRIFAEFGRRTGHEHPHFRRAINNYTELISAMSLSQGAIAARVRSAIEGEPEESA
jgi:tetratricopeptide (TPR) repeat protein